MTPSDEQKIVIENAEYLYVGIIRLKPKYKPPEDEYNVILLDIKNQIGIIGLNRGGKISLPIKKNRIVHRIPEEFQEHLKTLTRVYCSLDLTKKGKELLRVA